jgi:hypothetical protein
MPNSYESIETVVLTGTQAAIDFTNIPGTFKHLEIRYWANCNRTDNFLDDIGIQMGNGSIDTGNNYSSHTLMSSGDSGITNFEQTTTNRVLCIICVGQASVQNNANGIGVISIIDYTNTNKFKTLRMLAGFNTNSSSFPSRVGITSGNWRSTSTVTNVRLQLANSNWAANSVFALYGIKG